MRPALAMNQGRVLALAQPDEIIEEEKASPLNGEDRNRDPEVDKNATAQKFSLRRGSSLLDMSAAEQQIAIDAYLAQQLAIGNMDDNNASDANWVFSSQGYQSAQNYHFSIDRPRPRLLRAPEGQEEEYKMRTMRHELRPQLQASSPMMEQSNFHSNLIMKRA